MSNNEIISGRQLILLTFTFIIATGTLFVPAIVVQHAGRDGWLSILIGGLVGILVIIVVTAVGLRFPDKTLIEYSETILGKWGGKFLGLIYIWFFLHLSSIIVREISTTVHGTLLPKTSFEVITLIMFLASAFCVKQGLEAIARTNILVLVSTYIAIFAILFLIIKDMEPKQLTPFSSHGIAPVLKDAVSPAGWFGEAVSIAFLIPFLNKPKEARLHSIIGVIFAAVTLSFMASICIMIFGPKLTSVLAFPALEAVRYINVNDYIQRVEIIFLIPWIISNYIKICFFYYLTVLIISKYFKLEDTKPLVLPVGVVIFTLSLVLFSSSVDLAEFLGRARGFYALPIELGIPTLLLIIELIRKKGRRENVPPK